MATKRIQLTFELTTEKEWREFIQQPGLIVVDLYRDWAGPCVAMTAPLKTLRTSDLASDWMLLASAPSSIVPDLRRLEGSQPTFVLLSGRRLVDVIFSCNAPEVIRIIKEEIEREKRAARGLEKRQTVSLTHLSPAEVSLQQKQLGSEGDRLHAERTRAEMEADRVLRRILGEISDHLPAATVVVVFPYALQSSGCEDTLTSLRQTWDELGLVITREELMELSREAVDLMFWERRLPQHDILVDSVTQGTCLVLMLESQADEVEVEVEDEDEDEDEDAGNARHVGVEHVVAKSIYGFLPGTGSSMELITPIESATPRTELEWEEEDVEDQEEGEKGERDGECEDEVESVEAETKEGWEEQVEEREETTEEEQVADETTTAEDISGVEGIAATHPGNQDEDQDEGEKGSLQTEKEAEKEAEPEEGQKAVEEEAEAGGGECVEEPEGADEHAVDMTENVDGDGDRDRDEDEELFPQEPVRVWNPRELLPALDSAAARLLFRRDDGGPVLPGVWTPLTALSKAAAVKALFEDVAEPLFQPPTPPPPPIPESTVICFAGDKRDEVIGLSEAFPSEVTRYGFFTKGRKLVASSRVEYEKLVRGGLQTAKTFVVLEVSRIRSAPLLELATAGPLYISATPGIAKADVDEFFGSKSVRAGPDDLREIIKACQEEEGEDTAAAAAAGTEQRPSRADDGRGVGREEGGEAAMDTDVSEQPRPAVDGEPDVTTERADEELQEQPLLAELGDGEAVPGVEAAAAAEVAAAAANEEQLLSGTGEGDAPPRASLVGSTGAARAEE